MDTMMISIVGVVVFSKECFQIKLHVQPWHGSFGAVDLEILDSLIPIFQRLPALFWPVLIVIATQTSVKRSLSNLILFCIRTNISDRYNPRMKFLPILCSSTTGSLAQHQHAREVE